LMNDGGGGAYDGAAGAGEFSAGAAGLIGA
jgi:hypothetical protein